MLLDFQPHNNTISTNHYCKILQNMHTKIKNECLDKLTAGITQLYDNAHTYVTYRVQDQIHAMSLVAFKTSHIQLKLTTAQFSHLRTIKECPKCYTFMSSKVQEFTDWICCLVHQWDSCLNLCGNPPPPNLLQYPHPCTPSSGFQPYMPHRLTHKHNDICQVILV